MNSHEYYMRLVLNEAIQAIGLTSPNPMVGAVITDTSGKIISKGYHHSAGKPHAEINAIEAAGENAMGGILYVNLEPCCHHGRTPPCTDSIIAAGIEHVVIASLDPNPLVNGQGVKALKAAGIQVTLGILEEEARELNKFFLEWADNKKPWITLKIATTLNSKIKQSKAHGQYITGPDSLAKVHQLRSEYDAVLTTAQTVIDDDPQLNVRYITGRNPVKVIIDNQNKLAKREHKVFKDSGTETIVFTKDNYNGHLSDIFRQLAEREIISVLVEAGGVFNTAMLDSRLVNELIIFQNMEMLASSSQPAFYQGDKEHQLQLMHTERIGHDLMSILRVTQPT